MTIIIAGASGATGKQLTEQLLEMGHNVRMVVRTPEKLPDSWKKNSNIAITQGTILDMSDEEIKELVKGCDAVASCLGHNITLKGMYGHPRRLVTDTMKKLAKAVRAFQPETPVKFVLMNTTGNSNRDLNEPVSFGQKIIIGLLRLILPPHVDNEKAADFLRKEIGQNDSYIGWVAVRPDGLIDEEKVTPYDVFASPVRSPIFNPGKTSRINVGHFMATLISDQQTWNRWKGRMPVIYNRVA